MRCISSPDGAASFQEKSGRAGIGELFEAFQGMAHPALTVDFLEPFQALD